MHVLRKLSHKNGMRKKGRKRKWEECKKIREEGGDLSYPKIKIVFEVLEKSTNKSSQMNDMRWLVLVKDSFRFFSITVMKKE